MGIFKKGLCPIQRRGEIPGDEVHIAAVDAGGSAGEGERFCAVSGSEGFLQAVPEVEDLLAAFLFLQGAQGVAEEARHCAVGVEIVHLVVVGVQVAVDERGAAGGTGDGIQPPVGVPVFIGGHLIAQVAFQAGLGVGGQIQPQLPQLAGQFGQGDGGLLSGRFQHIQGVDVSHVGDFAQHLVGEGDDGPPDPVFLLPEHGEQLLAVGRDGKGVFAPLFQPDLHILPGDLPAQVCAEAYIGVGLAAYQDVPVLQHFFRGVAAEVCQLEQLDFVSLRGEDQFMLLSVASYFKGNIVKGQVQDFLHLSRDLRAPEVFLVLVHHPAQLRFPLGKGFPPIYRQLPEALCKLGKRDTFLAVTDHFPGVLIVRADLQRPAEVGQRPPFLIQVVIGISHTEVPEMVA